MGVAHEDQIYPTLPMEGGDKGQEYASIPLDKGIFLKRDGMRTITNIPRVAYVHSPGGFAWGYLGSGPSDLALNCVEALLRYKGYSGDTRKTSRGHQIFAATLCLYQDFKSFYIGPALEEGETIPLRFVMAWLDSELAKFEATVR